jgi:hypothetical protein
MVQDRRMRIPVEHDDIAHAGHGARIRIIDARGPSAQRRRTLDRSAQHPLRARVDAVRRPSRDDVRDADGSRRSADDVELRWVLQRGRFGDRQLRGVAREFAVVRRPAARIVMHAPGCGPAFRGRHTPPRCRGFAQHVTRCRARATQRRPSFPHARAAAGALPAERALIERRGNDGDLRPRHVQLIGDDHRQRRERALPHLDLGREHDDAAVRLDAQPRRECHRIGRDRVERRQGCLRLRRIRIAQPGSLAAGQPEGDQHAAARGRGQPDEAPARDAPARHRIHDRQVRCSRLPPQRKRDG